MPPRNTKNTNGKTTAISTVTAPREARSWLCVFIVVHLIQNKSKDMAQGALLADQHWNLAGYFAENVL